MKIKEINEDSWLGHKAKKFGAGIAAKQPILGKRAKGARWIRERMDELLKTWGEARGSGVDQSFESMVKWLGSGDDPIDIKVLKHSVDKFASHPAIKGKKPFDMNVARDFLKIVAQNETQESGKFAPTMAKSVKSRKEKPTGDNDDERIKNLENIVGKLVDELGGV